MPLADVSPDLLTQILTFVFDLFSLVCFAALCAASAYGAYDIVRKIGKWLENATAENQATDRQRHNQYLQATSQTLEPSNEQYRLLDDPEVQTTLIKLQMSEVTRRACLNAHAERLQATQRLVDEHTTVIGALRQRKDFDRRQRYNAKRRIERRLRAQIKKLMFSSRDEDN